MRLAPRDRGLPRRLQVESLEERRLLDAGGTFESDADFPWQNPIYRLDVNNDSVTSAADALAVINRVLTQGGGILPDPGGEPVPGFYDTNGDNRLSAADLISIVNGLLSLPVVETSFLAPVTADRTPQLTVVATARHTSTIPDGTVVDVDVDLNGNGTYTDEGEIGYAQSTIYNGRSVFDLGPELDEGRYAINVRARLKDSEALTGSSESTPLLIDTEPSTALYDYVALDDPSYQYHLADDPGITNPIPGGTIAGSYLYYVLDMTSQTWREGDVNLPVWNHWLELYVPVETNGQVIAGLSETAMLFIDGGSNTNGAPQNPNPQFALAAAATGTVVANLTGVPNQPVIFNDETQSRTEDEIIAYSFDKFMENLGQPGNETWPLLLPMTKSAVRAMDTVQDFMLTLDATAGVEEFLVGGGSKRGWTTWLTAAVDDRVRAILPAVYDNLNLGAQMAHHYGAYGFFSQAIAPYQDLNIFDRILSPAGVELARIVDPYLYLNNGRFDDMPKLLLNSPGDEFFATDSAQFYFDDIPGDQNYLRYVPNTPHSLNLDINPQPILNSLYSFYEAVLNDRPLPEFDWTVEQDGTINVQTTTQPLEVKMWQMINRNDRDFRRLRYPQIFWFPTPLSDQGGGTYSTNVELPDEGSIAYFIELTFPNPNPLFPNYVFTTEVHVKTQLPLFDWPFETGFPDEDRLQATPLLSPFSFAASAASDPIAVGVTIAARREEAHEVADVPTELPPSEAAPLAKPKPTSGPLLDDEALALGAASVDPLEDALDESLDALLG
ncbi:MAG: hypothetical protein DWQ37_01525 [Planctomycetota bacterium]|nr:MAG: hypothetical protein DWQ37_01525 [Planctomycetota bacterium]